MATSVNDFTVDWTILRNPAPWIEAGPGGRQGEITFLIALNDLRAFEQTLAGTTEVIDIGNGSTIERVVPLAHPDDSTMLALSYKAQAMGSPNGTGSPIHSTQF